MNVDKDRPAPEMIKRFISSVDNSYNIQLNLHLEDAIINSYLKFIFLQREVNEHKLKLKFHQTHNYFFIYF